MPAVLSAKLFVEAAKVGGSAFTGGLTQTLHNAMSSEKKYIYIEAEIGDESMNVAGIGK